VCSCGPEASGSGSLAQCYRHATIATSQHPSTDIRNRSARKPIHGTHMVQSSNYSFTCIPIACGEGFVACGKNNPDLLWPGKAAFRASPFLHARDKRDTFCATISTPSEHVPVQSDPGTSMFALVALVTLGLALRRDFMAILRLNRLAYLLIVVSDLPDDYTNDRASAAPFYGSAASIVWGSRGVGWRMPSQKSGFSFDAPYELVLITV
jgi:hypothetical protein